MNSNPYFATWLRETCLKRQDPIGDFARFMLPYHSQLLNGKSQRKTLYDITKAAIDGRISHERRIHMLRRFDLAWEAYRAETKKSPTELGGHTRREMENYVYGGAVPDSQPDITRYWIGVFEEDLQRLQNNPPKDIPDWQIKAHIAGTQSILESLREDEAACRCGEDNGEA